MSQDKKIYCTVSYFEYNLYLFFDTTMPAKKTYTTEEARARLIAFGNTQEALLRAKLLAKNSHKAKEYASI